MKEQVNQIEKKINKIEDKIDKIEDKPIEDKPIEIPEDEIEDEIEEIIPEIKKIKPNYDKTHCPDCGRLVSQKTLRYTHKYQCPNKAHPAPIKEEKPQIIKTGTQVHSPAKPTIMQSPYSLRQRYEHINLFKLFCKLIYKCINTRKNQ